MKKTISETAIGKIILIGEHSVVYGQPAIAIPFQEVGVKATIYKGKGPTILHSLYYKGELLSAPKELLGLATITEKIVNSFGVKPKGFNINIESTIPPERGVGSSAAVAIATIRGLYKFFGRPLSHEDLLRWANVSEKIIHGNPSGIDAATIGKENALYYIKDEPFIPIKFNLDAYLVIADTGRKGQTKDAVEGVRQFIQSNPLEGKILIKELGDLTIQARKEIENNNPKELGNIMSKAHIILHKLGVSNDNLNRLVSTAMDNSLGAKLTGGGRGGSIIALALNEERAKDIANNLMNNGADNTWISGLGDDSIEKQRKS